MQDLLLANAAFLSPAVVAADFCYCLFQYQFLSLFHSDSMCHAVGGICWECCMKWK